MKNAIESFAGKNPQFLRNLRFTKQRRTMKQKGPKSRKNTTWQKRAVKNCVGTKIGVTVERSAS